MGADRKLCYDEIEIGPDDRIALIGPNGTGKSTLIEFIVRQVSVPPERMVYIPQEIDRERSLVTLDTVRQLSRSRLGELITVVASLGSDGKRLLETECPSPGEMRKLLLAWGVTLRPYLIIMDEPTNHLDLPSIECLEHTLRDYPGALLLVSHDKTFLQSLTQTTWCINSDPENGDNCHLKMDR